MNFDPNDLHGILPALILSLGALVLLTSEVFLRGVRPAVLGASTGPAEAAQRKLPPGSDSKPEGAEPPPDRRYQAWLTAAFAAGALWAALAQIGDPAVPLFGGSAVSDGFARVIAAVVCGALLLSSIVAYSYLESLHATRGEFYALSLFSAAGMCLLAQATDLIVIFLSLEVMSLAVYALCAWLRRGKRPAEAAFKYFILGSFASALFLYGAALAFGATGSTRLADVANALLHGAAPGAERLLYAAAALLTAGFAFKVAAVPFHMWVPDVYEGAPAPVTGFMAAGVKAAAFAVLVRILVSGFGGGSGDLILVDWGGLLVWLAALTMLVGNLLAIPQRSVKRMLAYSSIAHAGYLLIAVASMQKAPPRVDAAQGLLFYLAAYAATVIGAFGVVAVIERRLALSGNSDDLSSWSGLSERHPGLAAAMSLFMISLAGVPPTAGFMAKLTVFRAAIEAGLTPLAVFGVLTSVAGLYYYLRVVVYVYMYPSSKGQPIQGGRLLSAGLAIAGCALIVLWMGVQPGTFAAFTQSAANAFARSSCATVARVDFADSSPFFSNACRRIPPILPAPRNATFFPARSLAIIFLGSLMERNLNHRGPQSYTDEQQRERGPSSSLSSAVNSFFRGSLRNHPLPLHPIPCGRHDVAQSTRSLPLQQGLRFRRIRYQPRRISRTPWHHLAWHRLSGHLFDGGDYLLHAGSRSGSNVDRKTLLPRRQVIQRLQVRAGQIVHVNIVANASSIRRRIVRSKHLQLGSKPRHRAQSHWNKMCFRIV